MFSGQNVDELTLINMCQKVGYSRFIMRDSANIRIEVSGIEEHYKELRKIEYTNERRRMSVVVRNKDTDQVTIFTKGADTAIVDLLATRRQFENDTIENSDVFAADGLRTLLLAKRELTADEVARVNELSAHLADWQRIKSLDFGG